MKLLENVWLYLAGCRHSELLEQKQVPCFPLVSSSPSPLSSSLPAFVRQRGRWGCIAAEVSPASAVPWHRRIKTTLSAEPTTLPNIFPSPPGFPRQLSGTLQTSQALLALLVGFTMGGCFLRLGFELQKGVGGCRSCDAGSGRAGGVQRARCLLALLSPPGLPADWSPGRLLSFLKI